MQLPEMLHTKLAPTDRVGGHNVDKLGIHTEQMASAVEGEIPLNQAKK